MPVSQGSAGGIPGLNLKAWAYVKTDGTLVRSLNVASVVKGSTGNYTFTFTAAMASADYVGRITTEKPGLLAASIASRTTGGCLGIMVSINGFTVSDGGALWEFYE
jgi:hypothetical protein